MYAPRRLHGLGTWAAAAGAAYGAYQSNEQKEDSEKKEKNSGNGNGTAPAQSPGGQGPIAVSPTFQQAFTPQISPTMVQQQDSPYATVTPTVQQIAPGGQQARGGGIEPASPYSAGNEYRTPALPPPFPSAAPFDINRYLPPQYPAVTQQSGMGWTLPLFALAAVALVGGGLFLSRRRGR